MDTIVFILGLAVIILLAIVVRMSQVRMQKKYTKKTLTSDDISDEDWAAVQKDFDTVFKASKADIKKIGKALDKVSKK